MKRIMGTTLGLFVIAFIIVAILISVIGLKPIIITTVDGESMNPTLEDRQKIVVKKMAFVFGEVDIDDIVVAVYEGDEIVKRVVGVPGDTIKYVDDVFYRNDVADPTIVLPASYEKSENVKTLVELKEGEYYLLGDNIEVSSDSRDMGAFDASQLLGKVIFK
jgi:signal peptidase I